MSPIADPTRNGSESSNMTTARLRVSQPGVGGPGGVSEKRGGKSITGQVSESESGEVHS